MIDRTKNVHQICGLFEKWTNWALDMVLFMMLWCSLNLFQIAPLEGLLRQNFYQIMQVCPKWHKNCIFLTTLKINANKVS